MPDYPIFSDEYDLAQTEDQANDVRDYFPGIEDYQYYMVKISDGEYKEVWGNSRPAADKNDWIQLYKLEE